MSENILNWTDLIEALRTDECVLLLGPRAATYQGEYLCDLLAERIALKLRQKGVYLLKGTSDLKQMASLFTEQFKNTTEALDSLGKTLRDFYAEFVDEKIPLYAQVSELPFKYIINMAPDNLLVQALAMHDKRAHFFDFHFNKPEYNLNMGRDAVNLDEEISEDAPLIYNLLGHYDRSDSLVLTDAAQIRFLEVVLQREKEATLPASISYFFTRPPLRRLRKAFIFIGFDFDEWHMRLFLHLLGRAHGNILPHNITLQDPGVLREDTHTFFTDNFNIHFVRNAPVQFLSELHNQLQISPSLPLPARMELLLLYHPDDVALRLEVETYLAPLRHSGLVDVWHENEIAPGANKENTLQEHLASARLIVPLLTANFLANERLFTEILPNVLHRHEAGSAKVAPIMMTPCDVEHTPLFELKTLNPKPRGKALSQKPDRSEALKSVVNDLRSMIERMAYIQTPNTVL